MWMFVPDDNGRALRSGIDRAWAQSVTDALAAILQQPHVEPDLPAEDDNGMTILAKIGPIKSMFGRSKGTDIIEAYRFTKDYAVQTAVRSAKFALPIWERVNATDKLQMALDIASTSTNAAELMGAVNIIQEQCSKPAEEAGEDAASYAAQAVESALLSAAGQSDSLALRAAAYSVGYAIQGAHRVNERMGNEMTRVIDAYLQGLIIPKLLRAPF